MFKRLMVCFVVLAVVMLGPGFEPNLQARDIKDCNCAGDIDMYDASWNLLGSPFNHWETESGSAGACQGECGDWVYIWATTVCYTYYPETIVVNWAWAWPYGWTPVGPQQYACSDLTR